MYNGVGGNPKDSLTQGSPQGLGIQDMKHRIPVITRESFACDLSGPIAYDPVGYSSGLGGYSIQESGILEDTREEPARQSQYDGSPQSTLFSPRSADYLISSPDSSG